MNSRFSRVLGVPSYWCVLWGYDSLEVPREIKDKSSLHSIFKYFHVRAPAKVHYAWTIKTYSTIFPLKPWNILFQISKYFKHASLFAISMIKTVIFLRFGRIFYLCMIYSRGLCCDHARAFYANERQENWRVSTGGYQIICTEFEWVYDTPEVM